MTSKKRRRVQRFIDRVRPALKEQDLMNAEFARRRCESSPKFGPLRQARAVVDSEHKLGTQK